MKKFALIGYPLGHSISDIIHRELLKLKNVDGSYELIEVKQEELDTCFENRLKILDGFNVTIPHKIKVIPFLYKLSEKAELYGSVNTVYNKNGKLIGYNTDCIGFRNSIKDEAIKLYGNVLVCGSGGVSRMFAIESVLEGADVTIAVRESSLKSANDIKDEIENKFSKSCEIVLLSKVKKSYDLIINGTPARYVSEYK